MVIPLPDDILAIRQETIDRFGEQEWDKSVLTNLIHGHLGIYSIIGVKMGLYAMELLGAESDHPSVSVISFAGNVPPMSCLNDGLQISTGSTLGRGLISVAPGTETRPEAQFTCAEKTILLSLKPEFALQIEQDITLARERFGQSTAYWQSVRESALRYWSTWDRHDLFTAMHSISTSAPLGSAFTATALLAGNGAEKNCA